MGCRGGWRGGDRLEDCCLREERRDVEGVGGGGMRMGGGSGAVRKQ